MKACCCSSSPPLLFQIRGNLLMPIVRRRHACRAQAAFTSHTYRRRVGLGLETIGHVAIGDDARRHVALSIRATTGHGVDHSCFFTAQWTVSKASTMPVRSSAEKPASARMACVVSVEM